MNNNFFYNKSVLVTGGAGFIGSHIVHELVKLGAKVTVLDNLSTGNLENINSVLSKINFIEGTITDTKICIEAAKNKEIIYHLAAMVSVDQSMTNPDQCNLININGTYNVLEAARLNNVKSLIFSSTCAVYGNYDGICTEETPCNPTSNYGYSKFIGEILCKQYCQIYKINTVILRYFNVFGPRQNPYGPYAGAMAKFRYAFENNIPITIFGDGKQTRDFVPVSRIVEANLKLSAISEKIPSQIFNIATGNSVSLLNVIENLQKEFPKYKQEISFAPARQADIIHSQVNCSKYNTLLPLHWTCSQ